MLKNIPWYIFIKQDKDEKEDVDEKQFFDKAKTLVKAFNINSDLNNLRTSAYPEAPIEYKHYLIYYLSEILYANIPEIYKIADEHFLCMMKAYKGGIV